MIKLNKKANRILFIAILVLIMIFNIIHPTYAGDVWVYNITIRIMDEDGNRIPNVGVLLEDTDAFMPGAQYTFQGTTDANGEYKINSVRMTTDGRNDPTIIITQTPQNYTAIKGWNGADTSDSRGVIVGYVGWDENSNTSIIGWSQVDTITVTATSTGSKNGNIVLDCKVLKQTSSQQQLSIDGRKLNLSTNQSLGDIFTIIKSDDKPASIKITDAITFFANNNITITNIKDIYDQDVALTSTSLVGTGYKLIDNNGKTYTAIVYGDATGDGKIDAADVNVVVRDFLGDGKKPAKHFKLAEDVQNDGIINAADMSLMINSFLGNLQGDILKTSNSQQSEHILN